MYNFKTNYVSSFNRPTFIYVRRIRLRKIYMLILYPYLLRYDLHMCPMSVHKKPLLDSPTYPILPVCPLQKVLFGVLGYMLQ